MFNDLTLGKLLHTRYTKLKPQRPLYSTELGHGLIETLYHVTQTTMTYTKNLALQCESDTLYLHNAVLSKDGNLAPVMTPCKVHAIIRPSTSLTRLTFMCRH